jgi:outer membrane receptor for ferrienterochelin and colicin
LLHSTFRQAKALSTLTLAIAISTAQAQDAGNDESTVIYPASFFEQYTPTSANDMVARIPGVSLNNGNNSNNRGGGGGRGLGTSGDLLINGKRLAGKDNSTSSQLTRISADQVERIEIIRGSSGAMDVRGASQVVNIVLKESTDTASISAEIGVDYHHDDTADPGGSFSYGGQAGNLNYLVNLEADPRYNGFTRTEYNYLPDRSLSEIVRENSYRDQTGLQASMTLGYDFTRDRVQFNALIGEEGHPYVIDRSIQRPPRCDRRLSSRKRKDRQRQQQLGNRRQP